MSAQILPPSKAASRRYEQKIRTLFESFPQHIDYDELVESPFLRWLCLTVQTVFAAEPNIVRVQTPVHICGDLHGQLHDLLSIFNLAGVPPHETFVFLGDYVDRGRNSLEVITILFCLKILYPKQMILIRGNHESREMTKTFGFAEECRKKVDRHIHKFFCEAFKRVPLCAVIDQKFFCVHGGIGPDVDDLAQISEIPRFSEIPTEGPFSDMLWSDPSSSVSDWGPNERGNTYVWGLEPAKNFLKKNNLQMIIRGHQVVDRGYEFPFQPDQCTVTVFSATHYAGEYSNSGCFMDISRSGQFSFRILPVAKPTVPQSARKRSVADSWYSRSSGKRKKSKR